MVGLCHQPQSGQVIQSKMETILIYSFCTCLVLLGLYMSARIITSAVARSWFEEKYRSTKTEKKGNTNDVENQKEKP